MLPSAPFSPTSGVAELPHVECPKCKALFAPPLASLEGAPFQCACGKVMQLNCGLKKLGWSWVCSFCTLINPPDASACGACERKPQLKT